MELPPDLPRVPAAHQRAAPHAASLKPSGTSLSNPPCLLQVPFSARLGFPFFIVYTVQSYFLPACLSFVSLPEHELCGRRGCHAPTVSAVPTGVSGTWYVFETVNNEKLFVVCLPWLEQEAPEPVWADHVCGAHLGTPGVQAAWEPSWSALKRSWMSPC